MRGRLDTADAVAALTRRLVSTSFREENTARQAHRSPTGLSMSGLGGCTRAAAYSIAGTEASDSPPPEEARQALLGTWIHEHLLPNMAEHHGSDAVVEEPVELAAAGLVIPGTLDLAADDVVWDLKSVKEWRLEGVRRRGTYSEHRVQVLGYALARYQAGHPVRWVCWLYIDRATGEIHVEVEEFTNAAALAVIERVEQIRWHADNGPDQAPREGRGPGLSFACDRCPWLRRCWGDDAVPGVKGPQRTIAATREGIEYALGLYAAGSAATAQGKRDTEFAKLILEDVPPGEYGQWRFRRGQSGTAIDHDQIAKDYADMGKPVPRCATRGRMLVSRVPQEER